MARYDKDEEGKGARNKEPARELSHDRALEQSSYPVASGA
jgi:hypothetical protein